MSKSPLNRCYNVEDLHRLANRRLPKPLADFIEGGADDEFTLRENTRAFDDYRLMPSMLRDVSAIDTRTRVLGRDLAAPLLLAPTGMSRLWHPDGELGACRAAAVHGVGYTLSTAGSTSIEAVGREAGAAKIFQLYVAKDQGLNRAWVERAKEAGFDALCLTVDTMAAGNRERDLRSGMTFPPALTPKSLMQFAAKPGWVGRYARAPKFGMPNIAERIDEGTNESTTLRDLKAYFKDSLSWDDAAELIQMWQGEFAIKGIMTVEDTLRAADAGATAVILSNHGGRQLDGVGAPVSVLADVRQAVGDRVQLIVDGGIRRGTHVAKALALGADACMIGRPYVWALAAGGQVGVERMLELLKTELHRAMVLSGASHLGDLRCAPMR